MNEEKKRKLTTQAKVMLAIIALMIIGIVTRWEFIVSEISTVLHNMFPSK